MEGRDAYTNRSGTTLGSVPTPNTHRGDGPTLVGPSEQVRSGRRRTVVGSRTGGLSRTTSDRPTPGCVPPFLNKGRDSEVKLLFKSLKICLA